MRCLMRLHHQASLGHLRGRLCSGLKTESVRQIPHSRGDSSKFHQQHRWTAGRDFNFCRLQFLQHSCHLPRASQREVVKMTDESKADTSKQESKILTLPTSLTLVRVFCIPALVAAWFGTEHSAYWTSAIFVAASITDFLDGYLARKMNTHSPFGAFLDPVADKLMVSTVLILLSSQPIAAGTFAGNPWLMPTVASAIIGREIAMSALREWAASVSKEAHKAVAVSSLGKWKTTTQMISLTLLLFSSNGAAQNAALVDYSVTAGVPLLLVATYLTLYSLYQYMRGLWKYLF